MPVAPGVSKQSPILVLWLALNFSVWKGNGNLMFFLETREKLLVSTVHYISIGRQGERGGLVASEGGIRTGLISATVFLLFAFQLRLIWPHSESNEMLFHLKVQTRSQKRFHFDKPWNSLPRKLLAGVKFWRFHLIWGTRNSGESGSSVGRAS